MATRLRQWLMTGVSYMIPFVAAGGILIALSFVLGGPEIASKVSGGTFQGIKYPGVTDISKLLAQTGVAGVLFKLGATAFSMLVPILAGFIAYAMADRPGLVPGIVAGLLASAIGAGFLGGLVGGLLAGAVVLLILKVRVPRSFAGIMPVVVIPLVSTLVVGFLMIVAIGQPIAAATTGMTDWLHSLGGSNAVLLGGLLGLMMAFDMGGPVNKVAYTFALAGLAAGDQHVMAAVIAAGMTPPLALALATVIRPKLFTKPERQAGEAAWLLGASFITEGAIPFAAADPVRVIPSMMVGSAVTGAMVMGFKVTLARPTRWHLDHRPDRQAAAVAPGHRVRHRGERGGRGGRQVPPPAWRIVRTWPSDDPCPGSRCILPCVRLRLPLTLSPPPSESHHHVAATRSHRLVRRPPRPARLPVRPGGQPPTRQGHHRQSRRRAQRAGRRPQHPVGPGPRRPQRRRSRARG